MGHMVYGMDKWGHAVPRCGYCGHDLEYDDGDRFCPLCDHKEGE